MSCHLCQKIKLYNFITREIALAFKHQNHCLGYMYLTDNELYVVSSVDGLKPILKLNCNQIPFVLNGTIQSEVSNFYSLCYIAVHRLIAFSKPCGVVTALSSHTNELVWELKGEVEGVKCEPLGMVYSPVHQALLVADGCNHRVLVLNPKDGSVRQVLQFSSDMGCLAELCLYQEQIAVLHHDGEHVKVSFFIVE